MGWTLMSWRMWRWGMLDHDLQLLAYVQSIYQLSCTASLLGVHLIFSRGRPSSSQLLDVLAIVPL